MPEWPLGTVLNDDLDIQFDSPNKRKRNTDDESDVPPAQPTKKIKSKTDPHRLRKVKSEAFEWPDSVQGFMGTRLNLDSKLTSWGRAYHSYGPALEIIPDNQVCRFLVISNYDFVINMYIRIGIFGWSHRTQGNLPQE